MRQEGRKAAPEPVYQDTPTWEEKYNALVASQPRTLLEFHNQPERGSKVIASFIREELSKIVKIYSTENDQAPGSKDNKDVALLSLTKSLCYYSSTPVYVHPKG